MEQETHRKMIVVFFLLAWTDLKKMHISNMKDKLTNKQQTVIISHAGSSKAVLILS